MASLSLIPPSCTPWKSTTIVGRKQVRIMSINCTNNCEAKAFFPNPSDERILKKALKEPIAFMGGMFAGLLRLDLNEDPLKEWVTRTVEASGIGIDEFDIENVEAEQAPEQIEID